MIKNLLFSIFIMLVSVSAYAQNVLVTGTVRSSAGGLGIPGASVVVRGSTNGVATDGDGQFTITARTGSVLTISAVGYATKQVTVNNPQNGRLSLNITLQSTERALDEVVVVAYGKQKKASITGSVGGINAKDLADRPITNVANALSGAAPGIQVSAENGQPGSSGAIRIRGFGSISASNSPLVVLDGVPFDGGLSNINANDIDNVSLLKDASSSALYGARAANGVLIVTTKRGKTSEPRLNFSLNQGISGRGIPEYERQGPEQYIVSAYNAYRNSLIYGSSKLTPDAATVKTNTDFGTIIGYNPFNVSADKLVMADGTFNPNAKLMYNDFDWLKPLLRTGQRSDYNMNVSASTGRSDYLVSLGYLNDKGYLNFSGFERFNGRVNVNTQATPWLKAGLNLSGTLSHTDNVQADSDNASSYVNPIFFSRNIGPIYPVHIYDAQGNLMLDNLGQPQYDYNQDPNQPYKRPSGGLTGRHSIYELMLNKNYYDRNLISARTYATVNLAKDLQFTTNVSTDLSNTLQTAYTNKLVGDAAGSGALTKTSSGFNSYTFNQLLTWSRDIDKHHVDILLGHENYSYKSTNLSSRRTSQVLDGIYELGNFTTAGTVDSYTNRYRTEGFFSRVNYDYNNRYFLNGSFRRDGSSRFSSESRWGNFYSVGAAWLITGEDFMKGQTWINDLKLKVSYGEVGNDALDGYYKYQAFYSLGWNNATEPGLLASSLPTPELQWETNGTLNAGLEFGLFKNRLSGSVEFFNRKSSNLLFDVPQPLSTPITSISKNIGAMYNRGIEINLNGYVVRNKDFSWNIATNFTAFTNKITKMPVETPTIISGTKQYAVGHSIYDYYLRQFYGVDPADGLSLYYAKDEATTDIRTINGNRLTTNSTNAKYAYTGTTAIPDFFGSVHNSLTYKNFNLSFLLNYQVGGQAYDSMYGSLMSMGSIGGALHIDAANAWTTPGQVTDVPRMDITASSYNNASSTRWLISASYFNIRTASLGYNFNPSFIKPAGMKNARIYVSGENLALFSKRKGLNPTESYSGVGSNTYLPQRIFNLGVNVGF